MVCIKERKEEERVLNEIEWVKADESKKRGAG